MLRLGPDGSYEERWRTSDLETHRMTPVYKKGYLDGFDGRFYNGASLVCLEWATSKLMWREQITWTERYLQGGRCKSGNFTPVEHLSSPSTAISFAWEREGIFFGST